jgi:hypothetical protein
MNAIPESANARRYLLGQASEEESALIEEQYFAHPDAIDRITAVEDDLIEDYLGNQLAAADRDRFERAYLSVPAHRVRVETVRRLMEQSARSAQTRPTVVPMVAPKRSFRYGPWLALAASLLVAASLTLWRRTPLGTKPVEIAGAANQPLPATGTPVAAPNAVRVFALTLSPVAVRGGAESAAAVLPAGATTVAIHFESDVDARRLTPSRAVIRTVAGRDVWQGPVTAESSLPSGAVGRVDVPATSLVPDDYFVTLFGTNQAGAEVEWAQYVLRVRGQ